jgi:hypothetical protein
MQKEVLRIPADKMETETRLLREVDSVAGTLTDKYDNIVWIHFSLRQTQAIINGIPSLRLASGMLEFDNENDTELMCASAESKTLRGGGIEAQVIVDITGSFLVIGLVKEI